MHFSAKRGIAIACRLSVRPSVCNVGGLWSHRLEFFANCSRMVTDSATVTMESLYETTIALSNGAIADPLRPPLPPKMGVPYAPNIRECHISATSDPIHFMFCSRAGSGTAHLMALFSVQTNPRWWPPPSWKNFKWPYIHNRSSDPCLVIWWGFRGRRI